MIEPGPLADPRWAEWDEFILGNPHGEFQQSSMWARYKTFDGWDARLITNRSKDKISGGFMVLTKKTRIGTVGYIAKGPVSEIADRVAACDWSKEIFQVVKELGLSGVIVQPPDGADDIEMDLIRSGFMAAPFLGIVDSTIVIPISPDFPETVGRIKRTTRQRIAQGEKRGLSIREGTGDDLPIFFDLMSKSCERQKVKTPNPPSVPHLVKLWDSFEDGKHFRLTLAEHEGQAIAGLLCVKFGTRLTLWKKGWSGRGGESRPNERLYFDAISWAHANGFAVCDFGAMSKKIAVSMMGGQPLNPSQMESRDVFNIAFGGVPKLLPGAMLYFRSPILRTLSSAYKRWYDYRNT